MFPREVIKPLVFGLAVLIVAFAVVMGGFALVQGTAAPGQTDPVARVFYGVGIGLLVLLVIDAVLLLVALGVNEVGRMERKIERRGARGEGRGQEGARSEGSGAGRDA